jgi:hypothetical protein
VHFRIAHEFEIPRDALELAYLSPDLVDKLSPRLRGAMKVDQQKHDLKNGSLKRIWFYRANVRVPKLAKAYLTPDKLGWEEVSTYDLKKHGSRWKIVPNFKPAWRKYFSATGTSTLEKMGEYETRRVIEGDIELRVPVVKKVAEAMILAEVRKAFEAEAETLRTLATLE